LAERTFEWCNFTIFSDSFPAQKEFTSVFDCLFPIIFGTYAVRGWKSVRVLSTGV
jgi:hypothetical protein